MKTEAELIAWLESEGVSGAFTQTIDHPGDGTYSYLTWCCSEERDIGERKLREAGFEVTEDFDTHHFDGRESEVKVTR